MVGICMKCQYASARCPMVLLRQMEGVIPGSPEPLVLARPVFWNDVGSFRMFNLNLKIYWIRHGSSSETMRIASSEFADDPCSSVKRGTMVRAARALLSAVTRLLILADMADVMRLLSHLKIVEEALEAVKNATNEQDLANRFKEFGKEMVKLNYVAARRQQELKDPHCRDEMAAARGALKKNATMLYTASQAFLRHPDVAATRANRDYVFKQVQEAIAGISNAAQATSPTDEAKGHTGIGELAAALNEFDNKIILDPMTFSEARFRPSLEERLESIISGAALMADSSCTRDDRRERIVAECNAVRQALQDLLSEYMNNVSVGLSILMSRWILFCNRVALLEA
ncbi:hypothetical protein H8959_013518 [Pygathrix nigripes]